MVLVLYLSVLQLSIYGPLKSLDEEKGLVALVVRKAEVVL